MAIGEVGLGGAVYHSGMGDFEIVDADRVAAQMRAEEVNKSGVVSALTAFLSNDRVELERAEAGDARHGKALGEVLSAVRTYLAEAPADGEWCFTVPLEDDKILQMRQNVNGMLEAAVSHLEDAETATYFQVPLSASRLSSAIVLDMLDNPDAYPADALLDSLADSGSAAVTNPIRREVYETIVEKKCGIAPGALGILNCAAMRSLALTALSCENPGMVADLADVLLQDAQYVQDVLKIDDEQALEIMANYERKVGGDPSIGDRIDVSALKRVRTKEEVTPEQRMAMEKDAKVHAFVADLIMNDNGYEFDTSKNGGDRVYGVLLKHIDVLGDILKDGDNELLATFPEEIRAPLGEALSEIRKMANAAILLAKGIDSVFGGSNTDEAYLRKILELGKPAFDGIDEQIDEVCNGLCARVGDLVKTSVQNLRDSIGASSVKPTFDDVVAAEKPADKLKALFQVYGKVLHRVATDKDLREAVRNGSYRPQDSLRSTSQLPMDNLIDSLIRSLAKLEVDDRGQLSVYEGERDAKANKIFEASEEDVIRYCMRLVNASGDEPEVEKNLHEVLMRGENGEMVFRKEGMSDRFNSYVEVVKADYQTRFERIISIDPRKFQPTLQEMKNEAADPTRGYPQLVLDVMSRYFDVPEGLSDGDVDIRRIDRRAMVASLVRNVKCANGVAPTHGQLLGGLFKGAGPIMQKALQGLPVPETEAEMYEAIQDMKSNLAPIPSEYVEAQLGDIIERSRGEIEGIVVDRSLGAASVGQAFLCTVTMRGGEQKSCVLKLLRPDARTRALRERTLFEQVANEIGGGMPMTFKGKLDVILKEFDFTIEANNVGSGRVYDQNLAKGFAGSGVESMKLFSGVAPTAGTMLLELAPGDNVGNFCDEMRVKVGTTAAAMQTTIDDGGELKMDDIMAQGRNLAVMKACSTRLMSLTKQWTREGIFRSGFYHGDLHAGNIMFDAELRNAAEQAALKDVSRLVGDMTVIDFGNAVQLSPAQQANVTKMMMGCLVGDAKWFLPAYKDLLSEEGRQHYEELDVVRTDDNGYVVDADGEFIFDENGKRMRYAGLGETENEMMIVNDDGETLRDRKSVV